MSMAASRATTLGGAAAALVGAAVLAGWWLDLPVLKSVIPGHVSMKPNTALGFGLAGTALLLLSARPGSPRSQRVGRWLALLVVSIGGLTLSEYAFGWRLGIDELLFKDDPDPAATLIPGRMAPSTAFNFLLLGLALLGIGWEPRRGVRPAEGLAFLAGVVGLISLLEYAVGRPVLYGFSQYTRMALHTAAVFAALSAGLLLARPAQGVVGALRSGRVSPLEQGIYAAIVLSFLALLAGGGWFYHAQEQAVRRDVEANLEAIARLKAAQTVQWRKERLGDAAVLMESWFFGEGVARWMAHPRTDPEQRILDRLRAMQRYNQYGEVLLTDTRGQVRLSLSGGAGAPHAAELQDLATAFREQRPILGDLHAEPADRTSHASLIVPLLQGTGPARRPIGAVVLTIEARQFLYPLIQSWPTASRTAETLLVRRDGDTVLFLNELRHRQGAALRFRIPLSRREVPSVRAVLGEEGLLRGTDYRGVKVLSALHAIPDSPWFLVAKVDEAEALAEWRARARLIVAVIVALALALAGATGVVWQQRSSYRALSSSAEALRRNQALLEMTERIGKVGGWDLDLASKQVTWTAQTRLIHEVPPEYQPTLEGAIEFYAPEARPTIRAAVDEGIDKGTGWDLELPFITATHRRLWVRAAGHAEYENGSAVRLVGIFQDITDRKRAEDEIRALNTGLERRVKERTRALEEANQELESFSYSVSHDLRQPLRAVDGFSQVLLEDHGGQLDAEARGHLGRIRAAAQRMGVLIDDLLRLSRVARVPLERQQVAVSALARELIEALREREPGRDTVVEVEEGLVTEADPRLLRIALENLLGNAWKFTRNKPGARIAVGASWQDGKDAYFVRDTGAGFDMAHADKLFSPFQRLHSPREFEGTGIGLAIVARIVRRHGGAVWAEGVVGEGATVRFTLGPAEV
jgi:signal transduction histidine kinase